jgi:hypothetical protein
MEVAFTSIGGEKKTNLAKIDINTGYSIPWDLGFEGLK